METLEPSDIAAENVNSAAALENNLAVPQKVRHRAISCDPAILGMYPRELKIYVHTIPCTCIFRAALFITVKMQKQPICPPSDKQISKMWYICTTLFRIKGKSIVTCYDMNEP